MTRYVPQPLVLVDNSNQPWIEWERCAIGRRRGRPGSASGLTIAWVDLPDRTIDAPTARKWAKAGKIELRQTERPDGSYLLEARPLRLGNGHAAGATEATTGRRQSRHAAVLAASGDV
jgi:hypothetical protein